MSADPSPLFGSSFEPTPEAVRARLDAVDPAAYARTRNALDGAVTQIRLRSVHVSI
jgi:deoxyribodipyrimidine photo-lyase